MSSEKALPVAFKRAAREMRREDENKREASLSTEETPWRWRASVRLWQGSGGWFGSKPRARSHSGGRAGTREH